MARSMGFRWRRSRAPKAPPPRNRTPYSSGISSAGIESHFRRGALALALSVFLPLLLALAPARAACLVVDVGPTALATTPVTTAGAPVAPTNPFDGVQCVEFGISRQSSSRTLRNYLFQLIELPTPPEMFLVTSDGTRIGPLGIGAPWGVHDTSQQVVGVTSVVTLQYRTDPGPWLAMLRPFPIYGAAPVGQSAGRSDAIDCDRLFGDDKLAHATCTSTQVAPPQAWMKGQEGCWHDGVATIAAQAEALGIAGPLALEVQDADPIGVLVAAALLLQGRGTRLSLMPGTPDQLGETCEPRISTAADVRVAEVAWLAGTALSDRNEITLGASDKDVTLGALDKDVIAAVIKEEMGPIRGCYLTGLRRQPTLNGKVVIKFVVAADGSVAKADLKSSTMNDEGVEACVVDLFRGMAFPAPAGGGIVIVAYPFVFSP
jgi:hypothetical protein